MVQKAIYYFFLICGFMMLCFAGKRTVNFYGVTELKINGSQFSFIPYRPWTTVYLDIVNVDELNYPTDANRLYYDGQLFGKWAKAYWKHNMNITDGYSFMPKNSAIVRDRNESSMLIYVYTKNDAYNISNFYKNGIELLYNATSIVGKTRTRAFRYKLCEKCGNQTLTFIFPFNITNKTEIIQNKELKPLATVTKYNRTIQGKGFHRNITTIFYSNIWEVKHESIYNCTMKMVEPITEYHFVETDFLRDIPNCKFSMTEDCDIELPSSVANQYILAFDIIYKRTRFNETNKFYDHWLNRSGDFKVTYSFPYHFRYQPIGNKSHETVEVLNPIFYIKCPYFDYNRADQDGFLKNPAEMQLGKMLFKEKANFYTVEYQEKPPILVETVPIALESDKKIVAGFTLGITIISVLCISIILMRKLKNQNLHTKDN